MATTAPGSPYVESSDLVANYPAVSEALAERVDTVGVLPFATSTARGTAIPSPTEGQYTYLQDTNATEYWDGSAWVAAGVAPGLVHINTTTFSAFSSVSVDDVFTSDYARYLILFDAVVPSSLQDVKFRLRASGTDATAVNYSRRYLLGSSSSVVTGTSNNSELSCLTVDTNSGMGAYEVVNPAASAYTKVLFRAGSSTAITTVAGYHSIATAYDGFTLFVSASSITGTIRCYGYKNGA